MNINNPIENFYSVRKKFNNDSLRKAVKEWLYDVNAAKSKYDHISNWDTGEVTDMSELFKDAQVFDQPIGKWNI